MRKVVPPTGAWYEEKLEANRSIKEYTQNKLRQAGEDLYLSPYVVTEKQPLLHSNMDDEEDRASPPYGAQTSSLNRVVPLSSPSKTNNSTSLHTTMRLKVYKN